MFSTYYRYTVRRIYKEKMQSKRLAKGLFNILLGKLVRVYAVYGLKQLQPINQFN